MHSPNNTAHRPGPPGELHVTKSLHAGRGAWFGAPFGRPEPRHHSLSGTTEWNPLLQQAEGTRPVPHSRLRRLLLVVAGAGVVDWRVVGGVRLMGGGATMKNIGPYLAEALSLPVHVWKLDTEAEPIDCAAGNRAAVFGSAVALSSLVWRAA